MGQCNPNSRGLDGIRTTGAFGRRRRRARVRQGLGLESRGFCKGGIPFARPVEMPGCQFQVGKHVERAFGCFGCEVAVRGCGQNSRFGGIVDRLEGLVVGGRAVGIVEGECRRPALVAKRFGAGRDIALACLGQMPDTLALAHDHRPEFGELREVLDGAHGVGQRTCRDRGRARHPEFLDVAHDLSAEPCDDVAAANQTRRARW
jgi:hypothetical protein